MPPREADMPEDLRKIADQEPLASLKTLEARRLRRAAVAAGALQRVRGRRRPGESRNL